MAICNYCGGEISDRAAACPRCGAPHRNADDRYPVLWGLLGLFIPLAGLILFLAWRDERPRCAKAAGIGALVHMLCWVLALGLFIFFWGYTVFTVL